jgi:hypothetical protein
MGGCSEIPIGSRNLSLALDAFLSYRGPALVFFFFQWLSLCTCPLSLLDDLFF